MTKELENFNKQLEERKPPINITDEMPDKILNMKLTDLLCKHIFNLSDKSNRYKNSNYLYLGKAVFTAFFSLYRKVRFWG